MLIGMEILTELMLIAGLSIMAFGPIAEAIKSVFPNDKNILPLIYVSLFFSVCCLICSVITLI